MSLLFDEWLVTHAMTSLIDEALAPAELGGDDYGLYSLLRRFGPTTPSQIGRWTGMRPTTVSAAIKRLEGRGHGERAPNPDDGRSYLIGLSDAGVEAHASAAPLFLQAMLAVGAELGSDHDRVRHSLARLDQSFRAVLRLDDRPYDLRTDAPGSRWSLNYDGDHLTPEQEGQALDFIDFLRSKGR